MKTKLILSGLIILCFVFAVIGLFGLGVYIREIFNSYGSNDKSLLYWYLIFLFAGIISSKISIAIGVFAYRFWNMRKEK